MAKSHGKAIVSISTSGGNIIESLLFSMRSFIMTSLQRNWMNMTDFRCGNVSRYWGDILFMDEPIIEEHKKNQYQ